MRSNKTCPAREVDDERLERRPAGAALLAGEITVHRHTRSCRAAPDGYARTPLPTSLIPALAPAPSDKSQLAVAWKTSKSGQIVRYVRWIHRVQVTHERRSTLTGRDLLDTLFASPSGHAEQFRWPAKTSGGSQRHQ